ncbi:FkbM family methyltransferase [Chloroflexus islandicus]|uniref:FkbM family methyltransferase n=1 Tax=Chloroflexus islandicus TaxID=1707952 RepID=A0A178MHV7_9CHLR|nr:FkbM family methyltransferase [Chloroflexus islandicus]OAN48256.1 FkbM family methyltransferase [Chloroflexus islandicus]
MLRRISYYLPSLLTLWRQIENWYLLPLLALRKHRLRIRLRTGYTFWVRSLMDVWIVKETVLDRDYETYGRPIQDGWTVIDIGAGIGEFSIVTAKEHPNCHVYAIEPFPESFALLQENLRLNAIGNVTALQTAIGVQSGQMLLATIGEAVQHSATKQATVIGSNTLAVPALSLEDIFQRYGIERCNFLKMDCEGCEFEVLLNANPVTLAQIDHLCLEYHNGCTAYAHTGLVQHLQRHGFAVKLAANPVHDDLGFLYAYRPAAC